MAHNPKCDGNHAADNVGPTNHPEDVDPVPEFEGDPTLPENFTYEDARRKLSPRHKVFVELILAGQKPEEALVNAGWNPKNDRQAAHWARSVMIKRPAVIAALTAGRAEEILEKMKLSSAWTKEWWRTEFFRTMRAAIDAGDIASRTRMLDMAGRHLGLLESQEKDDAAEQAARWLQGMADLMAVQQRLQLSAGPDAIKTIDATVQEVLGLPAPQSASETAKTP